VSTPTTDGTDEVLTGIDAILAGAAPAYVEPKEGAPKMADPHLDEIRAAMGKPPWGALTDDEKEQERVRFQAEKPA